MQQLTDAQKIHQYFEALFVEFDAAQRWRDPVNAPLLAHYTSIDVLESILKNEELWGFNPLLMNDHSEVIFGIGKGANVVRSHAALQTSLGALHSDLIQTFDSMVGNYLQNHVSDTYVFCLSEHDRSNTDGMLSMWRGYGSNGSGAAIIFDTSKVGGANPNSPILLAPVLYGTDGQRMVWLNQIVSDFAHLWAARPMPIPVQAAAHYLFERIKIFALFTKHKGFEEEREWRGVYLRERDRTGLFDSMLSYRHGPRGLEPVLKYKIGQIPEMQIEVPFDDFIHEILLGPTSSSGLAKLAMKRLLELIKKPHLINKVATTSTPLRKS